VGEQPELRTRTSNTTYNADHTFTATVSSHPLNYRDSHGTWQPIDSTLIASSQKGYAYQNRANVFRAYFAQRSGGDLLGLDVDGQRVTLSLGGAAQAAARVSGSSIQYANALPGVTARFQVGADSVEQALELADRSAPASFQLLLKAPAGSTAEHEPDGSWAFHLAGSADAAFSLTPPVAFDTGSQGLDPQDGHASLDVKEVAGGFQLSEAVDPAWLADPGRRFPVTLDPSFDIQPDLQDATFNGCVGCAAVNTGNNLDIGTTQNGPFRAAVQFDLGGIPANATVTGATLDLFTEFELIVNRPAASHTINAHRITQPWTSTGTHPTFDSTVLASFNWPEHTAGHLTWNVSSTVLSWLGGSQPNYGFLLKDATEARASGGPAPYSRQFTGDPTKTPKLSITYSTTAPTLFQPDTLHSNGAELHWTQFDTGAGSFQSYEVHRSTTSGFTPSASTLLSSTTDVTATSFRDTTAAPGGTFFYKVAANGVASPQVQVTLPADGQATKILQPNPATGKDSEIDSVPASCATLGASALMDVGASTSTVMRGLVRFGLQDIPVGASVTSATLILHHDFSIPVAGTAAVYRVTRDWTEGAGGCGDGATWSQASGGIGWTAAGGDFDPSSLSSVSFAAFEAPQDHQYLVTSAVQQWVSGQSPNLGLLVRYPTETQQTNNFVKYTSSDDTVSPANRPRLSVSYVDNSHAVAPTVSIASPAAGGVVRGQVTVSVAASDDRRVDRVELHVDGSSTASGTAAQPPFNIAWNTTGLSNASHTLAAWAFDDAGNVTKMSPALSVTVSNFQAPTTSITSPANNAGGLTGTVNVTTSNTVASGLSISKVELYADGALSATSTASPFSFSWNTLDPVLPAYDGTHSLTTRLYDSSGQVVSSSAISVGVANTASSKYVAGFDPAAVPQAMTFNPGGSQLTYPIDVTVHNNSSQSWDPASISLHYRWYAAGSSTPVVDSGTGALGLGAGQSATIQVSVTPPTLADGVGQAQFTLRFDAVDAGASPAVAFADRGNPPLDNPVIVNKVLSTKLGLEHFQQYTSLPVGAGMTSMVVRAGANRPVIPVESGHLFRLNSDTHSG
jgi:Bacterial Ig domain/Disaggregatase related repeat/TGF-beta propeptide